MIRCIVCDTENPPGAAVCAACGASLRGDPAAGPASSLPAGTQLHDGRYSVGRVLGQGGFGITYLGADAHLRRVVAIKEFFPHGSQRREREVHPTGGVTMADFRASRERFLDEARILVQFHHPGIVDAYDTFSENNTAYMVMEFLRGRSLMQLLEETGPVPEYETVEYGTRLGEALEVVHAAHLLHRDIKPDNVMLTDDGRVVLIDFGTARTFAAGKTGRMTTMVTPGYAPLEQYGQHVRFGPYTDVYALGATLYHILTGHMPADATDRATGAPLAPPRELVPEVSPGVSDAIAWAMAIRVDERPQTVSAFVDALRAGRGVARSAAQPAAPAPSPAGALPLPEPATGRAATPDRSSDLDQPVGNSPPEYELDVAPESAESPAGGGPFEVSVAGETLYFPEQCACCLQPSDARYLTEHTGGDGPFFLFEETRGWEVPYCSQCLEHVSLAATTPRPGLGRLAAGTLVGAALGGPVGMLVGLGSAAASSIFGSAQHGARLQSLLRPTCVSAGPAVAYLGWNRDIHRFVFLNRRYAEAFAADNEQRDAA
ncbi:MAG: hypothetical protein AVDCRST_MAG77-2775 [uncultured Chloroflexi bacterium]|uniref:Protein kinase domain-containing protein n=1 Tax=uncultured Chloroflexota bacterium TaxID=166587 RepID=A0A6J4IZM8_9CHLR|nr:MAG: hypothetical protein AVDCRST_MAG77-2775 [uncultured Chloroflexota bacterium]